jgi:agmatine/peptidylarginine deiminase
MSGLIHQAITTEKELTQLQEKTRARREIEEQILQLAAQRRVYLLVHQPQSESARPTLGQAVVQVIREQAQAKGFQLAAPDIFIRRDSEPSQGQ